MLCRQVMPDTNGIEQIYIVKSETDPECRDGVDALASSVLDQEVDQIKQEPMSDNDDGDISTGFGMLDVIIKEETEELERETINESTLLKKDGIKQKIFEDEITSSETDSDVGDLSYSHSETTEDDQTQFESAHTKTIIVNHLPDHSSDKSPKPSKNRGSYKKNAKITNNKSKQIRRKVIKRFVCHYCPKKFSTLFNMERHEKSHETNAEKQKCKKKNLCFICQQENETKDALHDHLCIHADMLPYMCKKCEKPVNVLSVRLLNKHFQLHKEMKTGIIKCMYCSARFHSLSGCRQHERGHVEQEHIKEAEARAELESVSTLEKNLFNVSAEWHSEKSTY
ncbi:zinc finger and SCAN domain containing protein 4D-like isoform X2 [Wyeomyia smithii]|uniref:zinc finger and SCAN domain containing protein 4D-like isoform X2 n=1 Tax=Wyeomyia smithii TaxID=174621 RepID=UPI002467D5F5|nr:zinc finger and SCAN domain containing protein 4D-like isoform X2 [Wyeomyia smithii]